MSELDLALERLHLCGFEYGDAQPNYGPMAVEALENLGHASLISGLLDVYLPRLPVLSEGRALGDEQRATSRGQIERAADWLASYEQAMAGSTWSSVLAEAFAPSGEALAALALDPHALVRVGHAVRSLSREDNAVRRRELAFALAYTAASCDPRLQAGASRASADALAEKLATACLQGAERYLEDPGNRAAASVAVVAPSALRLLMPHLPAPALGQLLANLLSRIGNSLALRRPVRKAEVMEEEMENDEVTRCAQSKSEIRYRAACSVHEHAIVMADACMREDEVCPNPILLRAAADAALRLSPSDYREWR